jgi:hypothetical protein
MRGNTKAASGISRIKRKRQNIKARILSGKKNTKAKILKGSSTRKAKALKGKSNSSNMGGFLLSFAGQGYVDDCSLVQKI